MHWIADLWAQVAKFFMLRRPARYYAWMATGFVLILIGTRISKPAFEALRLGQAGDIIGTALAVGLCVILVWFLWQHVSDEVKRIWAGDIEARKAEETRLAAEFAADIQRRQTAEAERIRRKEDAKRRKAATKEQRQSMDWVYFIADRQQGVVKIGVSRSPVSRMNALQTSNPHPLELLTVIGGGYITEQKLHTRFAHLRLNGEWFQLTDEIEHHIATIMDFAAGDDQTEDDTSQDKLFSTWLFEQEGRGDPIGALAQAVIRDRKAGGNPPLDAPWFDLWCAYLKEKHAVPEAFDALDAAFREFESLNKVKYDDDQTDE